MPAPDDDIAPLAALIAGQLADPDSHWGLGGFGAIAEFLRDSDEAAAVSLAGLPLSVVTQRGGIRVDRCKGVRAVAYETPAGAGWNQSVALCLGAEEAAMNGRTALTELGADRDALRGEDRDGTLFDLGLGLPHVDVAIRLHDSQIVTDLRKHVGANVFAPGNPAMAIIFAAQPHRVFMSRIARVEVFQPIPPPDGRSPQGPHTHVLPKLLAQKRTHAATEPIPDGLVSCLSFFPAHPRKDALGGIKPFEPARHAAFQDILRRYGRADLVALKQRVASSIAAGENPAAELEEIRHHRASIRVLLRQIQATGVAASALQPWLAKYERHGLDGGRNDDGDLSGCH